MAKSDLETVTELVAQAATAAGRAYFPGVIRRERFPQLRGLAGTLVRVAFNVRSRRAPLELERWFREVAGLLEVGGVEETAKLLGNHIEEAWAHEVVVSAALAILNGVDEAAVPFLARITARGVLARNKPDLFAERATALLIDLSADVLHTLQQLMFNSRDAAWTDAGPAVALVVVMREREPDGEWQSPPDVTARNQLSVRVKLDSGTDEFISSTGFSIYEVLHLLKVHRFAQEPGAGNSPSGTGGPRVAAIPRAQWDFLSELFSTAGPTGD
jgi:hypothetical protein